MTAVRFGITAAVVAVGLLLTSVLINAQGLSVADFKSTRPTPRTAGGRPDFSGYWKGTTDTKPVGNIGKDLPGWKLPLTPAGEAALKHNLTATVDPEAVCIIGGIPRHNASGLPFEILQGANKIVCNSTIIGRRQPQWPKKQVVSVAPSTLASTKALASSQSYLSSTQCRSPRGTQIPAKVLAVFFSHCSPVS